MSTDERILEAATCLGCGCACDDIVLRVGADRILEARNACELGVEWFGDGGAPSVVRVANRDTTLDDAVAAAARLLADARRPLVYLAAEISCEAQREAIAIADLAHAALDSLTSTTARSWILATQERGRASATLGEIRNRADLILFWGVDPDVRYPRYRTRYAPEPPGVHVPDGRRARAVVAVDIGTARGPSDADQRVVLDLDDEVATVTALTAIVSGTSESSTISPGEDGARVPWPQARDLAARLRSARYVGIVADAESPAADPGRAAALIALSQALNGPTRCALGILRGGGNRSGADSVMTSQTGYPMAVDFARGYPRYRPHDGSADALLSRGEVDVVVVVGSPSSIPAELATRMANLPCIAIGPRASDGPLGRSAVIVDTGVPGVHDGGTIVRMDDVPLPVRAAVAGPPGAAAVVRAIHRELARFCPI